MDFFEKLRIKWTYVTHRVDRTAVAGVGPIKYSTPAPGLLVLARVRQIVRHKDLEDPIGRKQMLFPGDVIAGALGHRYATDQFEGEAVASPAFGHLLGIGGVLGQVTSKNERMLDPTIVEWIGALTDAAGRPLTLRRFAIRPRPAGSAARPRTILSVGASMNAGKTTTAAQVIRSLTGLGHKVAAAKITGTACRKDPGILEDAGACRVIDFTHCGYPSTSKLSGNDLLGIAADLRAALLEESPEFLVYEIADGVVQRETSLLLGNPAFRDTIDAVLFAGPDSLACESGVRFLRELGYNVVATAGPVANSRLGIAEAEACTGVPCLNGESILGGALHRALSLASVA